MKQHRYKIELHDDIPTILMKMSEDNGEATIALLELGNLPHPHMALITFLHLDDMNIRGSQIVVGYKDHCKGDINVFAQAIKDRSPEMVQAINAQCRKDHIAVTSGASFTRR